MRSITGYVVCSAGASKRLEFQVVVDCGGIFCRSSVEDAATVDRNLEIQPIAPQAQQNTCPVMLRLVSMSAA
jgi:hypothetical protein